MSARFMRAARRRSLARLRRRDSGAVAVEFGLIAPMLLLLVFGLIDFGWMFNRDMMVNNIARDGARVASLSGSYSQVESSIRSSLSSYGMPLAQTRYSITCANPGGAVCSNNAGSYDSNVDSGATVVVTVEYTHNLMTPVGALCSLMGGPCVGNSVVLAKTAEMVRE